MANPTSNFNWQMPTPTDLVTDLPADFEVFGQAVDSSMADLLGGTTGQVLAKNSNTNMDFVWVAQDDSNAIQNAIVDAKGDLIAASANDTPARLAVGNNGETLVADSSQTTGLAYIATPSASNPVLNSAMQVWQRGTSISLAASTAYTSGFLADRWQTSTAANQATTVSRQATGDTTNLANIQYAMRFQRNSGQTGTTGYSIVQSFESINSIPFAGKTVTMSFYARAGATAVSSGATTVTQYLYTGTGTDQNIFAGFTGSATPINSAKTLTATWQRFTTTATLASSTTQLAPVFVWTPIGTAGATDYVEITGVQIDIGSVALPFRTNSGTIQGELAACQRYYYRITASQCTIASSGYTYATTNGLGFMYLPVSMRVVPTAIDYLNVAAVDFNNATLTTSSIGIGGGCTPAIITIDVVVTGATANRSMYIRGTNSNSYFGLSAEL
jgi:hypothetical protein